MKNKLIVTFSILWLILMVNPLHTLAVEQDVYDKLTNLHKKMTTHLKEFDSIIWISVEKNEFSKQVFLMQSVKENSAIQRRSLYTVMVALSVLDYVHDENLRYEAITVLNNLIRQSVRNFKKSSRLVISRSVDIKNSDFVNHIGSYSDTLKENIKLLKSIRFDPKRYNQAKQLDY